VSGYPDVVATSDTQPSLDPEAVEDALDRIVFALGETAKSSPESAALRTVLFLVHDRLDTRTSRARDTDHERRIQFLADLRDAAEQSLTNAIPYANKHQGVTWQRVGDLLGVSRQSAHERYAT